MNTHLSEEFSHHIDIATSFVEKNVMPHPVITARWLLRPSDLYFSSTVLSFHLSLATLSTYCRMRAMKAATAGAEKMCPTQGTSPRPWTLQELGNQFRDRQNWNCGRYHARCELQYRGHFQAYWDNWWYCYLFDQCFQLRKREWCLVLLMAWEASGWTGRTLENRQLHLVFLVVFYHCG